MSQSWFPKPESGVKTGSVRLTEARPLNWGDTDSKETPEECHHYS